MSRIRRSKMSNKKKVSAVMAMILIIALLTGGAFAWTEFSQSITNRFRGSSDNDVLLHDDFEPGVNKDVYVENTGENPLIIRVMFKEYFQIGNQSIIGGAANDKSSWITHVFKQETEPADCGLETHQYFEWVLSGAKKIFKPGTGEIGNQKVEKDQVFPDGTIAQETLAAQAPITMKEYSNNKTKYDEEKEGRWILDKDGWAYWSKLLPKGQATNLLLDNVIINERPDDNYYYAIDVILQASNRTEAKDILNSKEGATEEAEELILDLSGQTEQPSRTITGIQVKEGTAITEYIEGELFNTEGLILIVTYDDGKKEEVNSGFVAEPSGVLTTADTSVTISYGGVETELPITVNPKIGSFEFKAPYSENAVYTPDENPDQRIRFEHSPTNGFSFEIGVNHEVGLPLADIIDSEEDLSKIKITRVRINSISRDVDISESNEIADYKVYISEEGKLAVSFLPTYEELVEGDPKDNPLTGLFWKIQIPVEITLSNQDGSKTGVFTINAMFVGLMEY